MSSAVTLPAHAKVNLHLEVLGKRPDGYHELVTLFERVSLADEVTVERVPGRGVELVCDSPEVPQDETNLAVRAAAEFRAASGWNDGVRVHLKKRIPAGGGLGGGSSDAAAALLALQEISGGVLSGEQMLACAARLGSDVAFFVLRRPFALGRGRGEQIEPVQVSASLWHLLITPDFSIPTRSVYEAFPSTASGLSSPPPIGVGGKLQRESAKPSSKSLIEDLDPRLREDDRIALSSTPRRSALTAAQPDVKLLLRALENHRLSEIRSLLFNALEPTVETLYPAIRQVKEAMRAAGLERPRVSGSGSTVFALCDSSEQAEGAAGRIRQEHPAWRVHAVRTT